MARVVGADRPAGQLADFLGADVVNGIGGEEDEATPEDEEPSEASDSA